MTKLRSVPAIASAVALLALAACNDGGETATTPPDETVELLFWHGYTEADGDVLDGLVEQFNELHDDIEIRTQVNTWDVINDTLLPALSAGDGPELIAMGAEQIPVYAERGALLDLDEWKNADNSRADVVVPAAIDAGHVGDHLFAVPLGFVPISMFYNVGIFGESNLDVPTTWDEWVDVAAELTVDDNGDGVPEQYGLALQDHQTVGNGVWPSLLQSGGGGIVEGGEAVIDSTENLETLQFWVNAVDEELISPTGIDGIAADGLFSSGTVAMTFGGPWMATIAEENGIEYGIAPLPAGPAGSVQSSLGVSVGVTAQASEAQLAAAESFLTWFYEAEQATAWSLGSGWPPLATDVSAEDVAENPVVAALTDQMENSAALLPGVVNTADVMEAVDRLTQRALAGEDIETLLTEAQASVEQALQ